jgi:hypothetical protein
MSDVASCWIYEYIGILLGARPILHFSRIKVNFVIPENYIYTGTGFVFSFDGI